MTQYSLRYFFKQYLFWMLLFAFHRLLFFCIYFSESINAGFNDVFLSFFYALKVDNSTAAYVLVLPFLLISVHSFFPSKAFHKLVKYYSGFVIVLVTIIYVAEIGIYNEWGIKINYKALTYLKRPQEVFESARLWVTILGLSSMIALSWISLRIYNRFVYFDYTYPERNWRTSIVWIIVFTPTVFLSMRGGLKDIPVIIGDSYFSKSNFVNIACVNTPRNLIYSYLTSKGALTTNPFIFYPETEIQQILNELLPKQSDTCTAILTTQHPNVVLIILESWSGCFIKELGGDSDLTPRFSQLIKEGYSFQNHYVSGTLSHQAMASIFSGFPNTPIATITEQPEKYKNLPCLSQDLQKNGYFTSFLFGGQLSYGNIKAYMYFNKFDKITEGADFDKNWPQGRLGYHDEYLYKRLIQDVNEYPEPFFAAAFTLSSHSPYDQPKEKSINRGGDLNGLFNSVYYADSCLYDFIQQAKSQPWYKNTLFIFVADHNHPSPYKWDYYDAENRRAPLLFYGDVIKTQYKGKAMNSIVSQTDIPAILLGQLGINSIKYKWSKNPLATPYSEFAYYGFDDGFGWKTPSNTFVYFGSTKSYIKEIYTDSTKIELNHTQGKVFLQQLFQDFISY